MKYDNNTKVWVLILGVLAILGISALAVTLIIYQAVNQARQTIQPVTDMTSNLSTQVAQFLNPTPTVLPDPVSIVHQVRSLARLETIQYSIEKVITAETGQENLAILFGDKLIFVAHGTVIGGVDLAKIGTKDIWREDGVLYIRLPQPEIFIAALDNDKSYIYDRDTGLLTHGDINLETTARQAAEHEIEKAAVEDGILEQARLNAENYLYRLLREFGYNDVIFVSPEE